MASGGERLMKPAAPFAAIRRSPNVLIVAGVLFAAVLALRLLVTVPGWGITLLYDVPVALVAVAYGARAGLAAAALAFALFVFGENTAPIHVGGMAVQPNAAGYISRAAVFFLLGGLLGLYSDRLSQAQEVLSSQNRELERSNAELARFAYIASHDLQEPLRVINGFVELLARRYEGRLDEDADTFIAATVSGVERMQDLIDALLWYSRVGNSVAAQEPVDTGRVVRRIADRLSSSSEAQVDVIANGLPEVEGDPVLLEQLFENLMTNALKFSEADPPRVEISARRVNGDWTFSVTDNGPGIEPQHQEQIFEMFKRLHGRSVTGTGVGLAICRRITELHGGRIWVESDPGEGSSFIFTLPSGRPVKPVEAD